MPNRRTFLLGFLALLVIAVVAGLGWWLAHRPPAGATPTPWPTVPPFTPPPSLDDLARLYPEIADLLADTKLDSVYKEFLVAYQQGGLAAAEELARQRGLLNDQDELRLLLVLDSDDPEPLVAQLQAAGVRVENYYGDLVAVAVPLARIEAAAQAGDPGAALRPLTQLEHVIEIRLPESAVPQAGPVVGEGVAVVGADAWHTAGYTGQGIKVAILDGAFEGYQALLGTELPDNVVFHSFGQDRTMDDEEKRHGTACAEVIHEVAPDAELFLVTYDGQIGLGQAVDWLIAQDVDVISYSMGWLVGPRDGTSRQAQIVNRARTTGVLWVSSAGNSARSHYAALLTDADDDNLHEFSPGQETLAFLLERPDEIYIALNWDDWPRSDQDLDLYLMDAAGRVLASARDVQDGTQRPTERILYDLDRGVYYLVVEAAATSHAVHFDLFLSDGILELPIPESSLSIPADASGAMAVGATNWRDDDLESFSSRGPAADGRSKPEIAAPDGVQGVSYDRFFGTSAAAPHIAGAAALVLSAFPDSSPDDLVSYLQSRAIDLGPPGIDNRYGAGRLDLGPPPSPTPSAPLSTNTPIPTPTITPISILTTVPPAKTLPPSTPTSTRALPTPILPSSDSTGAPWEIVFFVFGVVGTTILAAWLITRHLSYRGILWAPLPRKQARFCRQCGQRARSGAQFCIRCGAMLGTTRKRCRHCGRQSRSSQAQFCGYCGNRL